MYAVMSYTCLCVAGVYLCVVMGMTSLSVVCAVFVLHIHHRGSRGFRAPYWLRKCTLHLGARILCMETIETDNWDKLYNLDMKRPLSRSRLPSPPPPQNIYVRENGQVRPAPSSRTENNHCQHQTKITLDTMRELWMLKPDHELSAAIWELVHKKRDKERYKRVAREWQGISAVIDRMLFVIFTLCVIASSVWLLWLQPLTKNVSL